MHLEIPHEDRFGIKRGQCFKFKPTRLYPFFRSFRGNLLAVQPDRAKGICICSRNRGGAPQSTHVKKKCCLCYSGVTLATMAPGAFCATQGRGGGGRTISKLEKFSNLTFAGRVARPNNLQIANGVNEKTGPSRGGRLKPFAQADQWLGPRRALLSKKQSKKELTKGPPYLVKSLV